jgi:hypothetical protein
MLGQGLDALFPVLEVGVGAGVELGVEFVECGMGRGVEELAVEFPGRLQQLGVRQWPVVGVGPENVVLNSSEVESRNRA